MKKTGTIICLFLVSLYSGISQVGQQTGNDIRFHGIVRDAVTNSPLPNSRILINRSPVYLSDGDGTFFFSVNKLDTVVISHIGYKSARFIISDTLTGKEFAAGVYLKTDTVSIKEVVIIPRLANLVYDILNTPVTVTTEMENAKYNVAVSAYQGKLSQGKLGDPASNYNILHQKQRIDAYEKGGIPSDRMIGLSPFMILPAAYLLLNGLPPKPAPMKNPLTKKELDQITRLYLENVSGK